MTIKELKEAIAKYPDEQEVYLAGGKTEWTYGLLNSVRRETIEVFKEGFSNDIASVVVLDEE